MGSLIDELPAPIVRCAIARSPRIPIIKTGLTLNHAPYHPQTCSPSTIFPGYLLDFSTMSSSNAQESNTNENDPPAATPRRTPMACTFCRGRKLKCDGRSTCANCERRGIPCVYVPVSEQQK
ncbi:unnamed protein product [Somion occarium]|uniref:Zn(2)-C6 fungal-type domain-containing protein n=1 Tax=Somion occarium TaxID=3059160 RepID=A0ABP1CR86_9APHY